MLALKKLRVRDLMQVGAWTIDSSATLPEAARRMNQLKCSSLVICPVDDSDAYGIITSKDILNAMIMGVHDEFASRVADVMTKPAITVNPALSIENCLLLMRGTGTRRLPVVELDKLVGLISSFDVFKRMVEELN